MKKKFASLAPRFLVTSLLLSIALSFASGCVVRPIGFRGHHHHHHRW